MPTQVHQSDYGNISIVYLFYITRPRGFLDLFITFSHPQAANPLLLFRLCLRKLKNYIKYLIQLCIKLMPVNCWQSCITFQLLAPLEAVLPKWMAFDLPSNRTKHYNHHQLIHCFKIDTDYNGNSFWRTSRFRESQASSISFLEAELQILKKKKRMKFE